MIHHNFLIWTRPRTCEQNENNNKCYRNFNYVSTKTKQLKNIKIFTFNFVGMELDQCLTLNMHVSSQSIMAIIKTFGEYITQGY